MQPNPPVPRSGPTYRLRDLAQFNPNPFTVLFGLQSGGPRHCYLSGHSRHTIERLGARFRVLTPPDSLGPVPGEYLARLSNFSFHSRLAFCGARAALRISMRATCWCILHVPRRRHLFECPPLFAISRFFLLFFAASNACLTFRPFFPVTTIAFLHKSILN